jgi:hypothetical protein
MVCLLIGHVVLVSPLLDLQGKDYDWGQYAVIGVVFPAFLFGVPLIWRWRGWSTAPAIAVKWMLAVTCLIVFAVFVVASMDKYGPAENQFWPVLALSTVQVLLMIRPWLRDGIDQKRVAILFIVAFVAWTATVSLFLYVYIAPKIFLTAFALAFLLVCWATWGPNDRRQASTFRLWSPANLAGLAFIVFMSFRTDKLFEVLGARGAIHHWGAWVAAADLVREGGWLLWDAPSNYGFLNVLAFNAVPTDTPWQSFYLLQALAYVVVSGGIFLVARSMRNGPLNWCLAMALAISIPMFTPTLDPTRPVSSTFIFPNAGPYRYLWAFVLVAILVWEYTETDPFHRQRCLDCRCLVVYGKRVLLLGCVAAGLRVDRTSYERADSDELEIGGGLAGIAGGHDGNCDRGDHGLLRCPPGPPSRLASPPGLRSGGWLERTGQKNCANRPCVGYVDRVLPAGNWCPLRRNSEGAADTFVRALGWSARGILGGKQLRIPAGFLDAAPGRVLGGSGHVGSGSATAASTILGHCGSRR